jgi:hypothetical protein
MKFPDKCRIDFQEYCGSNEIPETYCDDKVAFNYDSYCTKQVNCKE